MYSIALREYFMPAFSRFLFQSSLLTSAVFMLTACAGFSPSLGISFPIGGLGGVGVSVGGNGTVSGSVGVGAGGGAVSVGASGQLPKAADKKPQAEAAVEKKDEKKP